MEGSYIEGLGLKITTAVVRYLLGLLSMFGPMVDTSWNHRYFKIY